MHTPHTPQLSPRLPLRLLVAAALAISLPLVAQADPHHKHKHKSHKETYWDGHCKVERKWKGNGEYKEKRKCEQPRHAYREPRPVYVQPRPVYVQPQPAVVINPQIVIRP